ncbi:MAG TPA: porin, partial [Candidatus Polarisedimenticolia bacterium]|nr:porin [Candidatus Polarisedimenticolia bacterium]
DAAADVSAPGPEVEPTGATDAAARIEELEQRLRILERKEELEREQAAEKAKSGAGVAVGRDGFSIKTADGSASLRIRGYVQADAQAYRHDEDLPAIDTFILRRVRPIFEGVVGRFFEFKIMPDFGAGTTVLQDAYADWKFGKTTRLRTGKFKSPVGLERLQSATDLLFVVREAPTNLVPNRDLGLLMHGEPWEGLLVWDAGILNGVPDGGSADSDVGDGKDGEARLFVLPWKRTAIGAFQGLGFGVAATYGHNDGTPRATGLSTYKTPGGLDSFAWRSDGTTTTAPTAAGTTVADGRRVRVAPQAHWFAGRFGSLLEFVQVEQELTIGATTAELENRAWGATLSLLLTDDTTSYKGVTPKRPFDPGAHQYGAFEVVARSGALRVDEDAFPTFADPARSARVARDRGVGFNWYLNRNFRIMLDYIETRFDGGAAAGADRPDEQVLLNRFQVAW